MTVLPEGPGPAVVITGEIVAYAIAVRQEILRKPPTNIESPGIEEYVTRCVLEAVADMIVASWQHAEEDLH